MKAVPHQAATGVKWAATIMLGAPVSVLLSVQLFETNHLVVNLLWLLLNCWLFTGLFITAHDCMHNSVVPNQTKTNRVIGQLALYLYAGLQYDILLKGHTLHHRNTATDTDPDYLSQGSSPKLIAAFKWYLSFLRSYLTWHPFIWMSIWFTVFDRVLNVPVESMLWCWITPQVLSTIQLFYFGTYLPHRGEFEIDTFPARSNDYPHWLSMLTCFHFGYHAEHHKFPQVPWWYLPTVRTQMRQS